MYVCMYCCLFAGLGLPARNANFLNRKVNIHTLASKRMIFIYKTYMRALMFGRADFPARAILADGYKSMNVMRLYTGGFGCVVRFLTCVLGWLVRGVSGAAAAASIIGAAWEDYLLLQAISYRVRFSRWFLNLF